MATKKVAPRWKIWGVRAGALLAACALLWFAVEGGEYGTVELYKQRDRRAVLQQEVAVLHQEVDSLEKEKIAIGKNDAVLERIAREQYGMLRGNKELLFWTNNAHASKDSVSGANDPLAMR
jgi:cell division protein FtsB